MPVYYLTTDLFFSSRVCGVAQCIGVELQTVPSVAALISGAGFQPAVPDLAGKMPAPQLVIIDLHLPQLDLPEAVRAIKLRLAGCPSRGLCAPRSRSLAGISASGWMR